jgi:hypothetical protein
MQKTVELPVLLNEDEFCKYVGKSKAWAQRARLEGDGPPYVKVGRTPLYPADKVEAWLMGTERRSTCEERE